MGSNRFLRPCLHVSTWRWSSSTGATDLTHKVCDRHAVAFKPLTHPSLKYTLFLVPLTSNPPSFPLCSEASTTAMSLKPLSFTAERARSTSRPRLSTASSPARMKHWAVRLIFVALSQTAEMEIQSGLLFLAVVNSD